jgi:hypothetical protein
MSSAKNAATNAQRPLNTWRASAFTLRPNVVMAVPKPENSARDRIAPRRGFVVGLTEGVGDVFITSDLVGFWCCCGQDCGSLSALNNPRPLLHSLTPHPRFSCIGRREYRLSVFRNPDLTNLTGAS